MTNYQTAGVKSPFLIKSFGKQERKHPVREEIERNVGVINLTAEIQEDKVTLGVLNHIPGLVSYICVLKNSADGSIIGIGRGTSVINHLNKFFERTIRVAFNSAIIDSVMQSTKMLNTLRLKLENKATTAAAGVENLEPDLEGRDRVCSFEDDSTLRHASQKQRDFLASLIATKCDEGSKSEYLSQLNEKHLSSFQASELISSLLPIK
jgi:hypothetical protein